MFKDRKKRKKCRCLGCIREKVIIPLYRILFCIIQPVMVIGALFCVSFSVYLWLTHLRYLNKANFLDPYYIITTIIGVWFEFNVVFNYLLAVFVHAGTSQELFPHLNKLNNTKIKGLLQIQVLTPLISDNNIKYDKLRLFVKTKNEQIIKDYFFNESNFEEVSGLRNPYVWRYCDKCNLPKPPRAHHCSFCQRCILNMDHHCPWVASCVGLCNYKYFVLFMFWMCSGCLYFLLNAFPYAGLNLFFIKSTYMRASLHTHELRRSQSRLMIGCIFGIGVTFVVGCLLGFHLFLCLTGLSTIDMISKTKLQLYFRKKGKSWRAPTNNGMKKNWQFVFRSYGRFWWITWCLPMLPDRQQSLKEIMDGSHIAN